jgi:hypothetical protein
MRIISFIAVFAIATVVCADVTPSNSGVVEATSLQTRRLRGEVHEAVVRIPSRRKSMKTSEDGDDSAEATNQASPSRERKKTASAQTFSSTENDDGATSTPARSRREVTPSSLSSQTRPKLERQEGLLDLSHPKLERQKGQRDLFLPKLERQKGQLDLSHPKLERQKGLFDLNRNQALRDFT